MFQSRTSAGIVDKPFSRPGKQEVCGDPPCGLPAWLQGEL